MKIAYFVHGRGRGHATRAILCNKALVSSGFEVYYFAGSTAFEILKNQQNVIEVNSVMPGKEVLKTAWQRMLADNHYLKNLKPDVVISDGDAPSILVAKQLNIRSVAVGHGLVIPYFHHTIDLPKIPFFKESLNIYSSSLLADFKVATHFIDLKPKTNKAFITKPDGIPNLNRELPDKFLLSYFRDGNGDKILSRFLIKGWEIHNFGKPVDGCINHAPDQIVFKGYQSTCSAIIGSSGSNLVSEAYEHGIPMLSLYKKGDFEQQLNAKYLEKYTANCFAVEFDSMMPKQIDLFLSNLDFQNNPMKSNLEPFSEGLIRLLKSL